MWGKNWLSQRNIPWEFLLINVLMVSKKRATTKYNSNNNTKCTRNSGNCRIFPHCTSSAPAHLARASTTYLKANTENVVVFSPKSQDLNIIENIWDELNRRVRRTGAIPTTLKGTGKTAES